MKVKMAQRKIGQRPIMRNRVLNVPICERSGRLKVLPAAVEQKLFNETVDDGRVVVARILNVCSQRVIGKDEAGQNVRRPSPCLCRSVAVVGIFSGMSKPLIPSRKRLRVALSRKNAPAIVEAGFAGCVDGDFSPRTYSKVLKLSRGVFGVKTGAALVTQT